MKTIFKAEKKIPIVDRVIRQLRCAISEGKLTGGDRLVETEIADSMQISRNAVREAFRYLEKEGFITITPFKGAHVTIHSKEEIRQMFEAMSELEGMCVKMAIRKITPEQLDTLEALHGNLETFHAALESEKYMVTNWEFHKEVHKIAGNDVLNKIVSELQQKVSLYRRQQLSRPNRFNESIEEHRRIMDAFHKKDPDLGERHMREHLLRQGESLM